MKYAGGQKVQAEGEWGKLGGTSIGRVKEIHRLLRWGSANLPPPRKSKGDEKRKKKKEKGRDFRLKEEKKHKRGDSVAWTQFEVEPRGKALKNWGREGKREKRETRCRERHVPRSQGGGDFI